MIANWNVNHRHLAPLRLSEPAAIWQQVFCSFQDEQQTSV